jgi:hypothetical protein
MTATTKKAKKEAAKPHESTSNVSSAKKKSAVTLYWEQMRAEGGPGFEIVDMRAVLR